MPIWQAGRPEKSLARIIPTSYFIFMESVFYKSVFFSVKEFTPKHVYMKWGDQAVRFMHPHVLRGADILRALYGPLKINDWAEGGKFNWSGLRTAESGFAELSAHYRGCALDLKSKALSGQQMRDGLSGWAGYSALPIKDKVLKEKYEELRAEFFRLINEIEEGTPTWIHIAVTNRSSFSWIPLPK